MVTDELFKTQQGTIQLISTEIKEIKQLIKKARKGVTKTGTDNEKVKLKSVLNELEKDISTVGQALNKLRSKNATPNSVTILNGCYQIIKEQKQIFIDNYPKV